MFNILYAIIVNAIIIKSTFASSNQNLVFDNN